MSSVAEVGGAVHGYLPKTDQVHPAVVGTSSSRGMTALPGRSVVLTSMSSCCLVVPAVSSSRVMLYRLMARLVRCCGPGQEEEEEEGGGRLHNLHCGVCTL